MATGLTNQETWTVRVRKTRGKRHARRRRAEGFVPAILYGHGEESVSLECPADAIQTSIRHGNKVVDLVGDLKESAFIREVQWDTFGNSILHLDLTRVSAGESVETVVPIELRGEAPGTHDGGIVQLVLHEIGIECPVRSLPDKITININALELGQSILAGDLEIPDGARLLTEPEAVVVHCIQPTAEVEEGEEGLAGEGQEPEIIGRAAGEEGEGDED